jgi:hypothetical protein
MNKIGNFYDDETLPGPDIKRKMWKNIEKGIKPERKRFLGISDMPSFYFGIAFSVVLFFAAIGVYTVGRQVIYNAKPEEVKLNAAYQSAVKEFEKVVPVVVSSGSQSENMREYIAAKKEQLAFIDSAINNLLKELGTTDLTPVKQARLRQLYFSKIKTLQEMIDKGDVEL